MPRVRLATADEDRRRDGDRPVLMLDDRMVPEAREQSIRRRSVPRAIGALVVFASDAGPRVTAKAGQSIACAHASPLPTRAGPASSDGTYGGIPGMRAGRSCSATCPSSFVVPTRTNPACLK